MQDLLFFRRSETLFARIEPDGQTLRLRFSAANVSRIHGPGQPPEEGHLPQLDLVMQGVSLIGHEGRAQGELPDCMGALARGEVHALAPASATAPPLSRLPLPWRSEGPVSVELVWRQGTVLRAQAQSAHCLPSPEQPFRVSYAC